MAVAKKKTVSKKKTMQAVRRTQLRDELRQTFEQTIDAKVDRYLDINHQGIIGDHYFAAASSECIDLYRDGHFIATVMSRQAVNEGVFKFVSERNNIQADKHSELIKLLLSNHLISQQCADASKRIWGSFRNDVHHMNPKVAKIPFQILARKNLKDLAAVEREIFAVDSNNGRLVPKQPQYWDVNKDRTVPVFLRLGI